MRKGARPNKIAEVIILVVGICFPLAGCGHNPDLPPLAPVSGKVTLDGKPIDPRIRLHVQFIPDSASGTRGPAGSGGVAEDGSYSIITAGEDGAIVGTHTVRVVARPSTSVLKRYENPKTSGLSVEVVADQENTIDLPLTSGPAQR